MRLFILLFFSVNALFAQDIYPKKYFRKPLDIELVLSGTFGELRSNHFHAGLDCKTQQKQGLDVYAAAEGYVCRIKISHFGYGKALYITHPNGYMSVYAHLKKFSNKIEKFIKTCQYQKETYEIEEYLSPNELVISKDEIVAYSGNTGSSGGPHLHFEIRDNEERPINPMLFGINVKDTRRPLVSALYAYPLDDDASINGKYIPTQIRLIPDNKGNFTVENISAIGNIGFGVVTYDRQDLANNKNGVSNISTFLNGSKNFEIDFKRFSFDEGKYINRLIDYEAFKKRKTRIQKLFLQPNTPLSLYKDVIEEGRIYIEDSTNLVYKIEIKDFKDNLTSINIPITGKRSKIQNSKKIKDKDTLSMISYDNTTNLREGLYEVNFFQNTVYEDEYIDFKVSSDTLFLGKDLIPLQKNFKINFDISNYKKEHQDKLFLAQLWGYRKTPNYINTKRKNNKLIGYSKTLGTFTIAMDTVAPTVKPFNFRNKQWLTKSRYLKLKISDDLSGINNYRATVNGQWILMEYDYKTKTLTHDFDDGVVNDTENKLKVIVTDNVGNNTTFDATFYRK